MIDYSKTPQSARYAFTFWAFPRADWVKNLQDYLDFADEHFEAHGFRCNMPLGSYFVRKDTQLAAVVHLRRRRDLARPDSCAGRARQQAHGTAFLHAFNDWAHARGGLPLLNQSPFVTRRTSSPPTASAGRRFSDWIRASDPDGRLLNPYLKALLW